MGIASVTFARGRRYYGALRTILLLSLLLLPSPASADERPRALVPLYVSFAGAQAYDVYSTRAILRAGGYEANPLMGGLVEHPIAFAGVKAGLSVAGIYAGEKLWKTGHRRAAVWYLVGLNAGMIAIDLSNRSVLAQQASRQKR